MLSIVRWSTRMWKNEIGTNVNNYETEYKVAFRGAPDIPLEASLLQSSSRLVLG